MTWVILFIMGGRKLLELTSAMAYKREIHKTRDPLYNPEKRYLSDIPGLGISSASLVLAESLKKTNRNAVIAGRWQSLGKVV